MPRSIVVVGSSSCRPGGPLGLQLSWSQGFSHVQQTAKVTFRPMAGFPIWHHTDLGGAFLKCGPGRSRYRGKTSAVSFCYLRSIYLQPATPLASIRIPRLNLAKVSSATLTPRSLDAERLLSPGVFLRLSIAVNLGELHYLPGRRCVSIMPGCGSLVQETRARRNLGELSCLVCPLPSWLLGPPGPPQPPTPQTLVIQPCRSQDTPSLFFLT